MKKISIVMILVLGSVVVNAQTKNTGEQKSQVKRGATYQGNQTWDCVAKQGGAARKLRVETNMLPPVVFAGETIATTIDAQRRSHKVPAISVAVIRNGELDWSAAWGALSVNGPRADCSTLFQGGSLAKPVTLFAALRLQQDGLLDFDRSIETYLKSYHLPPGRQSEDHPVSFRNLFSHRSGITPGGFMGYAPGAPIPTDQQVVLGEAPANSRKAEVLTVPDESLAYSGLGYSVAEIALQDLLQQPFEVIMRKWILGPLGMRQADFTQPLPPASQAIAARGHAADGIGVPGGWRIHPEQAAAGLWATPTDLARFLIEVQKAYRGRSTLFRQADTRKLLSETISGHAYGFRVIGDGDGAFITHYGGTVGYRAGMTLNLKTGDGAVFLTNSENGRSLGNEFFSAVARVYGWPTFRETEVSRMEQPADVLRSLTGRYVFPTSTISVVYETDALTIVFPNGDRYAMTPIRGAALDFIHTATGVRVVFDREGADVLLQLYGELGRRQPVVRELGIVEPTRP